MTCISVLMPVYNGMPYIREAVESVLTQDYTNWELIISDNNSNDSTRDYLDSLTDPRIRIYKQTANLGIMDNLNFLLEKARYPVAKIFCQDDRLLEGALERVAQFMEERPNCAVSRCWGLGDTKRYTPGGNLEIEGELPTRIEPRASILAFATFGNMVGNLCKAACRPKLVLEAGGFDQNYPYAGDYEGWARVSARFGLDLQNEELVFERSHAAQNSNLLNLKNELYPQLNRLLEKFSTQVDTDDLAILKHHWTIHFFCQRISRMVRQLLSGKLSLSAVPLHELPLGISPMAVLAAYPHWKFKLPPAQATTRRLFNRILELNGAQ
jgi:glycosyltransferase involved in cell wall biosynthesis